MNAETVRGLVEPILLRQLGPFSFQRSEVRLEPDSYGEPMWEVNMYYGPGARQPKANDTLDASIAVQNALREHGEERFALLRHRFSNDVAGVR